METSISYAARGGPRNSIVTAVALSNNAKLLGYIPAATVYASRVSKGADWEGLETQENYEDNEISQRSVETSEGLAQYGTEQPIELCEDARFYFSKAAEGGDPLALEWLTTVPHAKDLSETSS